MTSKRILVVDDEPSVRFGLCDFLSSSGYEVEQADSCASADELFRAWRPNAALLDYRLPDGDALRMLGRMREIDATVPIIVLTGHASIDLAVAAMREGAEHFLTKPVELDALGVILARSLEHRRNRQKHFAGKSRDARQNLDPFRGASTAIRELAERARKIAASDSPVLIQGETGTGKSMLAAWMHQNGPRADEPFVDLNCAGLGRDLLESELFGHERGAFTGAVAAKQGLLEIAEGGTLFLDELGDMDLQVQPKLLKVLEEKRFRRVGDVRDRRINLRLIAATHQNLASLVRDGGFRSDLYFRVSTVPLWVPPLRERGDDVLLLAQDLLRRLSMDLGRGEMRLSQAAAQALRRYSWPGNVRELKNVIERAVLLGEGPELDVGDLLFDPLGSVTPRAESGSLLDLTLEQLEERQIRAVLDAERGNVRRTAERLGIPRSSLYQKMSRYRIAPARSER